MHDLCSKLDIPQPAIYAAAVPLGEAISAIIDPRIRSAVLKPERGTNGWCVLPLARQSHEIFRDILRGREMSVAEIHSRLQSEAERREIADNWILEELMLPLDGSEAPIDDFKVYAFYGRAELILQKANFSLKGWRRARYRWYDRNWRPIETGKHDERIGNDLRPPSNRAELISAVEAWSSRIPYPFMRIDAYNASRGIVCGELTACPGNRERFNAPTSRRLAEAWFDADARLKADLGERSPH